MSNILTLDECNVKSFKILKRCEVFFVCLLRYFKLELCIHIYEYKEH